MKTYKKVVTSGSYILVGEGSKEKLLAVELSAGDILIHNKGVKVASRVLKKDETGYYFIYNKTRFNFQ